MLVDVAAMLTEGVTTGLTAIVIGFEVTAAGDGHVAVEVMTHVTTCALVSALLMNVGLLVPTLVVPTFH